jgi:3-hydroxyisobutyrate dehydrogenase
MGFAIAANLLRNNFTVVGCDINKEALAQLTALGGQTTDSPADLGTDCEALIVVVNAEQVEQVLFGKDGAAAQLKQDTVVLACSTVPPDFARRCATRLQALGLHYLDAPISGGAIKAAPGLRSTPWPKPCTNSVNRPPPPTSSSPWHRAQV